MIEVREVFAGDISSLHTYESEAVASAIRAVSLDGVDRIVDGVGVTWMFEADTKVDEDAPFFPVIVHRWEVLQDA